ncbi:MAG: thioredoxin domain-containing protein [Bacilli bacterium]|nr:thioredoxin domain-containing protein [Bacilli bacterium]
MKIIRISAMWCTSCIVTYNIWQLLQKVYPHFEYIEYDYDFDEEIIKKYKIGNIIPVIIILNEQNEEIKRIIGEKTKEEIFEIIKEVGA